MERLSPSYTPLHPTTCYNPLGRLYTTETLHHPRSSLYKLCNGRQVFFWILEPRGWDQQVVPKCQLEITTTYCLINQKSGVLQSTILRNCAFLGLGQTRVSEWYWELAFLLGFYFTCPLLQQHCRHFAFHFGQSF